MYLLSLDGMEVIVQSDRKFTLSHDQWSVRLDPKSPDMMLVAEVFDQSRSRN